jgi:hypothetical protein
MKYFCFGLQGSTNLDKSQKLEEAEVFMRNCDYILHNYEERSPISHFPTYTSALL